MGKIFDAIMIFGFVINKWRKQDKLTIKEIYSLYKLSNVLMSYDKMTYKSIKSFLVNSKFNEFCWEMYTTDKTVETILKEYGKNQ